MVIFAVLGSVSAGIYMNSVRQNDNAAILHIITAIRQKYPAVSEIDIVKILNDKTDDSGTQQMLKKYGISENDWIFPKNETVQFAAVINNVLLFMLGGAVIFAVFLVYVKRQNRDILQITGYLSKINSGHYDLCLAENAEGEMSILKNEVYKTTVNLREQYQNSLHDKISLKDSISDISHQLKTPLTSLMLMLDTIIDTPDMPDNMKREFLCDMKNSTEHISFLIQSLLKLSKLDANSVDFLKKTENMQDLLNDCIKKTELLAEIREVNVSVRCKNNHSLFCDKKWLTEALTNIIKNCIEHTPSGGSVTLSADEGKFYTKITVSDTGCGISREELPHIFERFYKTKNSSANSIGIGLSLAKSIIEKHDGYIMVDSQLGVGTVFTIKFLKNLP